MVNLLVSKLYHYEICLEYVFCQVAEKVRVLIVHGQNQSYFSSQFDLIVDYG